jgi:hypothetical protein
MVSEIWLRVWFSLYHHGSLAYLHNSGGFFIFIFRGISRQGRDVANRVRRANGICEAVLEETSCLLELLYDYLMIMQRQILREMPWGFSLTLQIKFSERIEPAKLSSRAHRDDRLTHSQNRTSEPLHQTFELYNS